MNHKRVYRLYSEAGLAVRKRRKIKRPSHTRVPLRIAQKINEVGSRDFVSDRLANGRRLKCLTITDDFSRECVHIGVDYVTRLLDQAAVFRGYPRAVRTDKGPELTRRALIAWTQAHGIQPLLIEPGKPMQHAYIESFIAVSLFLHVF